MQFFWITLYSKQSAHTMAIINKRHQQRRAVAIGKSCTRWVKMRDIMSAIRGPKFTTFGVHFVVYFSVCL